MSAGQRSSDDRPNRTCAVIESNAVLVTGIISRGDRVAGDDVRQTSRSARLNTPWYGRAMSSPGAQQGNNGTVSGATTSVPASGNQQPTFQSGPVYPTQQQFQQVPQFNAPDFSQLQRPRRQGSKWWAWGLGGALVASAVWAVGVFAVSGSSSDKSLGDAPDLRGYQLVDNFCKAADVSALREAGYSASTPAIEHNATSSAIDMMTCQMLVTYGKSSSASGSLVVTANIHKKVDPAVEFESFNSSKFHSSQSDSIRVSKLSGIGDSAYRRVEAGKAQRVTTVAVRDGGLVLELTLSQSNPDPLASPTDSGSGLDDSIGEMLKKVAAATMDNLHS
ncbi:hypothetical protein [Nocardia concava]|uniref:hypothetical protein n=1 Tax=Nocardia concava TaxID=257281 RepID=UPI0012FC04B0|nr:hypothetical protein [Nocardia concava]